MGSYSLQGKQIVQDVFEDVSDGPPGLAKTDSDSEVDRPAAPSPAVRPSSSISSQHSTAIDRPAGTAPYTVAAAAAAAAADSDEDSTLSLNSDDADSTGTVSDLIG